MKLLMLGGSKAQAAGIILAQKMGHEVVVCDYIESSIGHQLANKSYLVSTFDHEGVLEVATNESIDGIMTYGTDQPVATASYVSTRLNLSSMISYETALCVTNKIYMKKRFDAFDISTVNYQIYKKGDKEGLKSLKTPLVVKPVDSQGQRGIYFLKEKDQVDHVFDQVISFSRTDTILVEEYYDHDELTVSGWVHDGKLHVLTITDRVTFTDKSRLGICLSHEFPSKYLTTYGVEIIELSNKIVSAFDIQNGPIYFQLLVGKEGILVNEVACRIGGAYESDFMESLTGFDILRTQILCDLGLEADFDMLDSYDVLKNDKHLSVQLFFIEPCTIKEMVSSQDIEGLEGVLGCGFNVKKGDTIDSIENATARGGYVIIEGENREQVDKRLDTLYSLLKVLDEGGNNRLIHTDYNEYRSRRF